MIILSQIRKRNSIRSDLYYLLISLLKIDEILWDCPIILKNSTFAEVLLIIEETSEIVLSNVDSSKIELVNTSNSEIIIDDSEDSLIVLTQNENSIVDG